MTTPDEIEAVARALCRADNIMLDEPGRSAAVDEFWHSYADTAQSAISTLLSLGYARRGEVAEECAKVADSFNDRRFDPAWRDASFVIASTIRSLAPNRDTGDTPQ